MAPRFKSIPVDQLFWSILDPVLGDNRCWEWPKHRNSDGYGGFALYLNNGKKEERTHRVAWILAYGLIPKGMSVLHHCDNPPCCRPSHLFLGRQRDNIYDMFIKKRNRAWTKKSWGRSNHSHIEYTCCVLCGMTVAPHKSRGRCASCYDKLRNGPTCYSVDTDT